MLTILGPRRVPAIPCPTHSTNSAISICTSVGFSQLHADQYHEALQRLKPDIAIIMADVITNQAPSLKRVEKSVGRTQAWLRDASEDIRAQQSSKNLPAIFAAIPPIDNAQQLLYLRDITEEYRPFLSGLALYSSTNVPELPSTLNDLPRFCLSDNESPHSVLSQLLLGVDLLCVPFVGSASDHGIALTFHFPGPNLVSNVLQPLGIDLWSSDHETSILPLSSSCNCFTCTRHHMAYLHHLLQAKEMLAWTLLQIHNLAIMDSFFEALRRSIGHGTLEEDAKAFNGKYEADLPLRSGAGPRTRGYQTKSTGGGEPRKNPKSWGRLEDAVQKIAGAELEIAIAEEDSKQLEDQGFGEKT